MAGTGTGDVMAASGVSWWWRPLRLLGAALLAAGMAVSGAHAAAAFTAIAENGMPGQLRLAWGDTPQLIDPIVPGEAYHWQIRATLDGSSSREFSLTLRAAGALVDDPMGLRIAISQCDQSFTGLTAEPTCAGPAELLLPTTRVAEVASPTTGDQWQLDPLLVDQSRYFLVTISTPAEAADSGLEGLEGEVGFGFAASGDSPAAELPPTGADALGPLLLALGLLGLGAVQVLAGRMSVRGVTDA
ncbi:hypothetical protein HF576_10610 [Microbacterium sp. CFH 90308]|uniref:LPXTG-motif cell wall anchor domain-containing protein n=1 Tax=Microbacterium salsuginis TaxID=2722803 RepID=A0ABX1KD91_9MICO|nr:hypothetical protein [Microbacterium sp. CFH 90308]NLP84303.1 hypothetical protein [Microbacterium sp. CFH 90308]